MTVPHNSDIIPIVSLLSSFGFARNSACWEDEGTRRKQCNGEQMKVAIVGKGGVGKTTVAALLARRAVALGRQVVAVDADPDGNLASALGVPEQEVPEPIAAMRELILERTEAKDEGAGLIFRLNPEVEDLPERFSVSAGGVRLLVLGTVEAGGKGCMCPEGAVLKALMQHLLLRVDDDVVLDMEAGLEHIGRASARGVDAMIAVVEPGMRSVRTATRIRQLARQIGIDAFFFVANRVRSAEEEAALRKCLAEEAMLGVLPYSEELARADLEDRSVEAAEATLAEPVARVAEGLEQRMPRHASAAAG